MAFYNPFAGEYRSLTPWQLWNKYQDWRAGKEEQPETVGEWKQDKQRISSQ